MQISSINMILPKNNYSFKGNDDGIQRRHRRTEREYEDRRVRTPQPERYYGRKHKKNHAARNAMLLTLAGVTAGTITGNVATTQSLRNRALENPIPVVSTISGAPQDLIYEWQINGMTVYPEVLKEPVVSSAMNFSPEQLQNIQTAQENLADVYYNNNNGQYYAVLKKNTDIREIKATFGISMSKDGSVEKLNNLYNKPTIGADLNTAMIRQGEIVKFDRTESGIKENFYGSLLVESNK